MLSAPVHHDAVGLEDTVDAAFASSDADASVDVPAVDQLTSQSACQTSKDHGTFVG